MLTMPEERMPEENIREIMKQVNANQPPCVDTLGKGRMVDLNTVEQSVTMEFTSGDEHCHSGNIVQGGFVAGMLDNAMSVAVILSGEQLFSPATLELKVTYLKPASQGINTAKGWIVRMGKSIVFLEAELHNKQGALIAKASSTAQLLVKSKILA
ncbi:MAG: hypothetical protein ACI9CE_002650 [Flavobacterium sp.]|jgi:uncharacterized protein (TIGR00369 family)